MRKVEEYQQHAKQCRALAARMTTRPEDKVTLEEIAKAWEKVDAIAEMLRLIDGTSRGLPDPTRIPKDRDEIIDVTPTHPAPTEAHAPAEAPLQSPPEAAPRMKTLLSKSPNSPRA